MTKPQTAHAAIKGSLRRSESQHLRALETHPGEEQETQGMFLMTEEVRSVSVCQAANATHTWQYTQTHRALEDHAVTVAHALDVRGQVEADGPVTDGIHGLGVEEVVRPRCKKRRGTRRHVRKAKRSRLQGQLEFASLKTFGGGHRHTAGKGIVVWNEIPAQIRKRCTFNTCKF